MKDVTGNKLIRDGNKTKQDSKRQWTTVHMTCKFLKIAVARKSRSWKICPSSRSEVEETLRVEPPITSSNFYIDIMGHIPEFLIRTRNVNQNN